MNNRGVAAEDTALRFLEAQGLTLRARNYACRFGEIDLIVNDKEMVVFVEVRKRSNSSFGTAAESITSAKRARLVATAAHYLARQRPTPACRFDAVLIDAAGRVEWIRDAFGT
ncbi:MAG TPA: YraN family protein [Burkholderiales bacterium]|nr:YraN family protein [Burkholderiales bacterium]